MSTEVGEVDLLLGHRVLAVGLSALVLVGACSSGGGDEAAKDSRREEPESTTSTSHRTRLRRTVATTTPATLGVGDARAVEEAPPTSTTTRVPLNPGALIGTKGTLSPSTSTTLPVDPAQAAAAPSVTTTTGFRSAPRGAAPALAPAALGAGEMTATVGLGPVDGSANDAAVWVHPKDPAASLVIGTDRRRGLVVWDLAGQVVQSVGRGAPSDVDLRDGYPLAAGQGVSLVVTVDEDDATLTVYRVDAADGRLVDVGESKLRTEGDGRTLCLYRSPGGAFFAFTGDESGRVQQWALVSNGGGRVGITKARAFSAGGPVEGCVADDAASTLFVSVGDRSLRSFPAEPGAEARGQDVDRAGGEGHLTGRAGGLTLVDTGRGLGYLIASSANDGTFAVYRRSAPYAFVGRFAVRGGDDKGGCQETEGVDAVSRPLGGSFPAGVFVCHTGRPRRETGFKLVPLEQILRWAAG